MDLKNVIGFLKVAWGFWGILLCIFFLWYAVTPYEETVIPPGPMNLPGDSASDPVTKYRQLVLSDMASLSTDVAIVSEYMSHPEAYSYTESGVVVDAKVEIRMMYSDWESTWVETPDGYGEFHSLWLMALEHYAAGCDTGIDEETAYSEMLAGGEYMREAAQSLPRE